MVQELVRQTLDRYGRVRHKGSWGHTSDRLRTDFDKRFCEVWGCCRGMVGARSVSLDWSWYSGVG